MIRRVLAVLGLFILFAGAGFLGLDWLMSRLLRRKGEAYVPNLIGLPLPAALEKASQAGLSIQKMGEKFDEKIPAGTVLQQVPAAAMPVRPGRPVRVLLSAGSDMTEVPDLIGQDLRGAQIILRRSGLVMGERTEVFSDQPAGRIAFQRPAPRDLVARGTFVDVSLSLGPPPAVPETAAAGDLGRPVRILYHVPLGEQPRRVQVRIHDGKGEREIYDGMEPPGARVELSATAEGPAFARIFLDGVPVKKIPLE